MEKYVHLSLLSPTPLMCETYRSWEFYGRNLEANLLSWTRREWQRSDMDNSHIALPDAWWWSGCEVFIVCACKHYLRSTPYRWYIILIITRPIGTYNKRGDQKPSIDLATHTIIHEAGKAPPVDDEARKLMKEPIAVILEKKAVLDPDSMLDFGMIHSVHRNIRVEPVGELTEESKRLVGQYLREVVDRGIPDRYRCI